MTGQDVMVVVAVVGQFALVGLIAWVVARRLEQKAALRAQLEMKLIERFSSAKELEEFLATDAGRRLLGVHSRHAGSPLGKIVGTVQVGVALVVLGFGVLVLGAFLGHKGPVAAGTLVLTTGIGLVAAAAVGRRLIRTWGLAASDPGSTAPSSRD